MRVLVLRGCVAATLASLASGFGVPAAPTGCSCTMNAEHTTSRRNMIIAAPLLASAVLSQAAHAVENNAAPGGRTRCTSLLATYNNFFNFAYTYVGVDTVASRCNFYMHSFDSVSTQVPPSGKEQAPLSDVPFRNLPSGVKIKVQCK
jgi:hypothetical protein